MSDPTLLMLTSLAAGAWFASLVWRGLAIRMAERAYQDGLHRGHVEAQGFRSGRIVVEGG